MAYPGIKVGRKFKCLSMRLKANALESLPEPGWLPVLKSSVTWKSVETAISALVLP